MTMVYLVRHVTQYDYETAVSQCQSEMRLTPRPSLHQRVWDVEIATVPVSASRSTHKDYFGNDVTGFTILEPHDQFTITATSRVEVDAAARAEVERELRPVVERRRVETRRPAAVEHEVNVARRRAVRH